MDRAKTLEEIKRARSFFVEWIRREHPDMTEEEIVAMLAEPWDNVHRQLFGEPAPPEAVGWGAREADRFWDRKWKQLPEPVGDARIDRFYEPVVEGESREVPDDEK